MAAKKNQQVKKLDNGDLVFIATVKRAFVGGTRFDDKVKNRLTLYNPDFDYSMISAYDDSPAKLTPSWFKDAVGYINLNSKFDIPVKDQDGTVLKFEDWVQTYTNNAIVKAKIRQKDGSVYPVALIVMEPGDPDEQPDYFEDM
jgi:hypothetical protein